MITAALMRQMWPHGDSKIPGLIDGIVDTAPTVFEKYGLTTKLVIAHFMAQMSFECNAGLEVVENLNYSTPERIKKVWPTRFSVASAVAYVHNPQKLADKVYNGRMGNRMGTDDGWNYRGRGGTQTTGREGYERLGNEVGLDLLGHPDLVNDPAHFLECSVADFILCGCLPFAQKDDVRGVTQKLNGGQNGISDRISWLARWKASLRDEDDPVVEIAMTDVSARSRTEDNSVLRYGAKGYDVEALQKRLSTLGYKVGKIDGDFGAATRSAVLAFQADNNLTTDGIVGSATRDALKNDEATRPLSETRIEATADTLRDAGSETIKTSDKIGWVGKALAFLGLGTGLDQTGGLQKVVDTSNQIQSLSPAFKMVQDFLQWIGHNAWIVFILGGILIYFWVNKVIERRVQDHIEGNNLGR